jgi:uncharacterized membrane protein
MQRIGVYITILGIVVMGAWLRFQNLSADSIWLDEAVSWLQSKGTFADLISATAKDNYPPLHNLLLFTAMSLSGSDVEWVLRAPSTVLGIGNIVAIYWLSVLIEGPTTGRMRAAIVATSGFHIFFSQEARMYSLPAAAATLLRSRSVLLCKISDLCPRYTDRSLRLSARLLARIRSGELDWHRFWH